MILVIDNYDSFTWNLVQAIRALGREVIVLRNDVASPEAVAARAPTHLVISPGPRTPADAGASGAVILALGGKLPILGVCLGHQCLASCFGGKVVRAARPMHGKTSFVHHDARTVFAGLASPFEAMRYHSLVAERASLPACLEVSAWTAEGEIMGLRHRTLPRLEGVQFHPESFRTPYGPKLIANFLEGPAQSAERAGSIIT